MQTYLLDIGVDVWLSVENGYNPSKNTPTDPDEKKTCNCNYKTTHNIFNVLSPNVQSKVICFNSVKEVWDKLKNMYEGDEKFKQVNLQLHREKFENMKMKESENFVSYLLRVDEIINSITRLWEEVNESMIVQKVLRSLPLRYDAKVSTKEESRDLTKLKMDEPHGIFTYEMRTKIENEQPMTRESTFKASKKTRSKEHKE